MEIKYDMPHRNGEVEEVKDTVEEFVVKEVVEKVPFEKQPKYILRLIGRLLDKMLEKNLITSEEFYDIVDADYWFRKAVISKEE